MKQIIWIFIFGFLTIFKGFSQEESKKTQKKYQQALNFISESKFDAALTLLKECNQEDPNFAKAYQVAGDIYRKRENYALAKQNYQKVLQLNPDLSSNTYFGIGEAEIATGDYQNSKIHFEEYLKRAPKNAEISIAKAQKYIIDCDFSVRAIQNPVPFQPQNLGNKINTEAQEYLPSLTADEKTLVFTRRTNNNEDFFNSNKINGEWQTASPLKGAINTDLNEGAQAITPDGRYLFFAGCNRPDGKGRCDIYISSREGKQWSAAQNLGEPINTTAWESQPSISADGNTLYFISNRSGGYGGYDIWKSTLLKDGSWGEPVNLGPNINTKFDEMSPFIHPDGSTLYFASNGWPGMGNKDMYMSKLDDKNEWSIPQNLGYPINTFGEESSMTVATDGKHAYFASDKKEGFGGLDIFIIDMPEKVKPNPVSYVSGKVIDKYAKEPLIADVQVVDINKNKVVYDNVTEGSDGTFLAIMPTGGNYALTVSKQGYLFYSANFQLDKEGFTELKPFEVNIDLEKIKKEAQSILANVFFETNKFDLLPKSLLELNKLYDFLVLNPKVTIQIEGHTDDVGSEDINNKLSVNRAKSVYDFLINKGITLKRLSYAGFGKSKPIASNDSDEGRQLNRRTAFRITGM